MSCKQRPRKKPIRRRPALVWSHVRSVARRSARTGLRARCGCDFFPAAPNFSAASANIGSGYCVRKRKNRTAAVILPAHQRVAKCRSGVIKMKFRATAPHVCGAVVVYMATRRPTNMRRPGAGSKKRLLPSLTMTDPAYCLSNRLSMRAYTNILVLPVLNA